MPLILGENNSKALIWNVDASYAVQNDMRSHTRASLSLGHVTLMSMSCKQKLVKKRLTEVKLVGVDDVMTFVMWSKYFFQEQAKEFPDTSILKDLGNYNGIEQDNTGAIQLE